MSKLASRYLFLVLITGVTITSAFFAARSALENWLEVNLGVEVHTESIHLSFTRNGPALRLTKPTITDPKTNAKEHADAVYVLLSTKVEVEIEGLKTHFDEVGTPTKTRYINPVWESLIGSLTRSKIP